MSLQFHHESVPGGGADGLKVKLGVNHDDNQYNYKNVKDSSKLESRRSSSDYVVGNSVNTENLPPNRSDYGHNHVAVHSSSHRKVHSQRLGTQNAASQRQTTNSLSKSKSKKHKRTASLTDLRPEDKKKVANLIQELANLGSEKDDIETLLRKERADFEVAIKDLIKDQKALLLERTAVQSELNSCQQMLSQLQEAIVHRPNSLLSRRGGDESNNANISNNQLSETNTLLDNYISNHNNTQGTYTIDAISDIESVASEAAHYPRSVLIHFLYRK